jgi:hypothetical protein
MRRLYKAKVTVTRTVYFLADDTRSDLAVEAHVCD